MPDIPAYPWNFRRWGPLEELGSVPQMLQRPIEKMFDFILHTPCVFPTPSFSLLLSTDCQAICSMGAVCGKIAVFGFNPLMGVILLMASQDVNAPLADIKRIDVERGDRQIQEAEAGA